MSRRARIRDVAREAKHAAFYGGPEDDDTDDEGGIDTTDGSGPAGTFGCACVRRDPRSCLVARSNSLPSLGEQCECLCHTWSDHDD